MNQQKTLSLALFILLAPAGYSAAGTRLSPGITYDSFEIAYANADYSAYGDANIFGTHLLVKHSFAEHFYTQFEGQRVSGDANNTDVSVTRASAMFGFYSNISDNADYYFGLSYEYSDSKITDENGRRKSDIDGLGVTIGAQGFIDNNVLLDANIKHIDTGESDDLIYTVGGSYYLSENIAVTGEYSIADEVNRYQIGLRYDF